MALRVGDKAPTAVELTWTASDVDMTQVVDVDLKTKLPGGGFALWTWNIESADVGTLVLRRMLSNSGGDLPQAGTYKVEGFLVMNDGELRRVGPVEFPVDP